MSFFSVKPIPSIKGSIALPGDKSIAHRSVILSAVSCGKTVIKNFPLNQDCLSTFNAFKKLGVRIRRVSDKAKHSLIVYGRGLYGLQKPGGPIFVGDSGTTLRLLTGVLAGQNFKVTLRAGKSLSRRPMRRVTLPLRMMGAKISAKRLPVREEYPPITISGRRLHSINYKMPVASAQVKSAILLAGLYAKGSTRVRESLKTRDHTERMLSAFGATIKVTKNNITVKGGEGLVSPGSIYIPGDISSASFFIVLAAILIGSRIRVKNVSLNPSRTGVLVVLRRMGAKIKIIKSGNRNASTVEPMGDLLVTGSRLKGTTIKKKEVPGIIDELPILMVAACNASGRSIFEGVGELRVKETDRIKSMSLNLKKMGANIEVIKTAGSEKIIIKGTKKLKGAKVRSFRDHRTAMSMVVAGLKAEGPTRIDDIACIKKSFPDF